MRNIQVEINPWLKILLDDFLEESRFLKKGKKRAATLCLTPAGPVTLVQRGMKCMASFGENNLVDGRVADISRNNGTIIMELTFELSRKDSYV